MASGKVFKSTSWIEIAQRWSQFTFDVKVLRTDLCLCSNQRQQSGVEEDVRLCDVHAADELPEVSPVVQ